MNNVNKKMNQYDAVIREAADQVRSAASDQIQRSPVTLERGFSIKGAVALILSHNSRRQPHRSLITDGEKKELTYADHCLTAGCPQGWLFLSPLR